MWAKLATSKVGSFECALSRVAGSAKNGKGRGRTWKVRPSLCGIPRDGSAPSRCVVLGGLCLWRGWNPQRQTSEREAAELGKHGTYHCTAFSDGTSYEQDVGLLNNLIIELIRISGLCLPSIREQCFEGIFVLVLLSP